MIEIIIEQVGMPDVRERRYQKRFENNKWIAVDTKESKIVYSGKFEEASLAAHNLNKKYYRDFDNLVNKKFMTQEKEDKVKRELAEVINRNSLENYSNTPDWVLADYLFECLSSFHSGTRARDNWYGGKQSILDDEKGKKWMTNE